MRFSLPQISLLFVVFCLASCSRHEAVQIDLTEDWQFRQDTSQLWREADVPGSVHTDLLQHELIPDPFFGSNEQELQWIGETQWSYRTQFDAGDLMKYEQVELVFDGLDTYAKVYLNDSLIRYADNMFRQWVIDVKHLLKPGLNELNVNFLPPEEIEQRKAAALSYPLPDNRAFTRKAPYQYGWDWGPKFLTAGIWRPVYLKAWNDFRISSLYVHTVNIEKDTATMAVEVEIVASEKTEVILVYHVGEEIFKQSVMLKKGVNTIPAQFVIREPELWWPNGLGAHPLYEISCKVSSKHWQDNRRTRFGIRTIELVQQEDSIGQSFFFEINGVPVFIKGANYIPQDNFPARVTDEKYRQTIQHAVDANMNMLRVWGGGIYEKDIYYNLCDEQGIMVWQDFMFACNMYPGDPDFIENIKNEATGQVKRLRNHPSVALWCGNNEVSEGWHNWGWQQSLNYSTEDSTALWNNYLHIFEEILPEIIADYSPAVAYHPSSPAIGWGREEALNSGDMHYWGVWWGEEPFSIYEEKTGRFMSEYGFQGFPDLRSLDSCLADEDQHLSSDALLNHQKHPRGMQLIRTYMEREYPVPDDFEDYVYVSQLVQAYGVRKAIEAHRRAMPRCMGTLYWQLNDCWPVISWSSLDYYNRWKALHYFVKEAYRPVLISFEKSENEVSVFVISDRLNGFQAELRMKIVRFDGKVQWQDNKQIRIEKQSSQIYQSVDLNGIIPKENLLVVSLFAADSLMAQNLFYFAEPKDLKLPQVNLSSEIAKVDEGYRITLSADNLAKNVWLSTKMKGHFSENYFNLLPGTSKTIHFTTPENIKNRENDIDIVTLNEITN